MNRKRNIAYYKWDNEIWDFIRSNSHIVTLFILVIFVTIFTKGIFIKPSNLSSVLTRAAALGMISIGQTLVILTSGIDLTVSANVGLSVSMMALFQGYDADPIFMIMIGCAIPALIGSANGILCAFTRIPPFIVTLGMSMIVWTATFCTLSGETIFQDIRGFIDSKIMSFVPLPEYTFPAIIWILSAIVLSIILKYSRFGHNIYALGGKEKAAYYSGVNVKRVKIFVYTISGLTSGIGGLLYSYKLVGINPLAGKGFLLESIAATIIGGTLLSGGEGSIFGAVVGALVITIFINFMNIIGMNPFIQEIIMGIIIIVFVYTLNRIRIFATKKQYKK
jgi:ribose transport system permease protein